MSNADLIEEMRWQLRKIEERKADNARLLAQADPSGTSVTSPDGTVTVLVAAGIIQEVRLTPEAMRSDVATLSATITATLRAVAVPACPAPAQPVRVPRRRPAAAHEEDDEPFDTVFDE